MSEKLVLDRPSIDFFVAELEQAVQVQLEPEEETIGRVKIIEAVGDENYKLTFSQTEGSPLEQGTYWFEFKSGTVPIFIVPVGQDQNGLVYEAIYN